jgi:hypothetical protein
MSGSSPFQIPQECPGQPDKQATACPGVQLSIGGANSGATYHWHQAAWNALLVGGTRRWHFLRPRDTAHSRIPARDQPAGEHELTCVQEVGDVVYIPSSWGHRTVNEGDVVISVSKEVPRAMLRCVFVLYQPCTAIHNPN